MWDLGIIIAMNNNPSVKKKMSKGLAITIHMPTKNGTQSRFTSNMNCSNSIKRKERK